MAHELRAPLQGVSGFARYLLGGEAGPLADGQATCLQQIDLGTQHVLQLIQDALELTDQDVARRDTRNAQLDTKQTLLDLVQVLQPLAAKRGIAISVHSDEHVPQVVSDVSKLKQVLLSITSNLLQHAQAGGTLSISVLPAGEARFCVEVRDAGPGLTRLQLDHINHTSVAQDSFDLTRRTVAALGGTLTAFNVNDKGAVIRLDLPLRPSSERPYLRSV
jgi:signal transduction histidine kinase